MGFESKNSTSLPRHVHIADGGVPNLPPSEGTDDDVVIVADGDSYQEQDAVSKFMYNLGNVNPATIRSPVPLIEPIAMQAYFNWYDTWRMAEIITHARNTPMPAILDLVRSPAANFETSLAAFIGDVQKATQSYTFSLARRLRVPVVQLRYESKGVLGKTFGELASASTDGSITVNIGGEVQRLMVFETQGHNFVVTGDSISKALRDSIAHEITHLDHIGALVRRAHLQAARETGIKPSRASGAKLKRFNRAYRTAFKKEYNACRAGGLSFTATDRRLYWQGGSFTGSGLLSEKEAYLVSALVSNPNATTYVAQTKKAVQHVRDGASRDILLPTRTIPTALQHPEKYEGRFLNPGWKDVPFRFAYNLANNRAFLTAFRSAQIGLGALSLFDIASAVSSTTDPTEDRLDATLAWTNVLPSVGGASLFTYGMLAAKLFFMLAAGIPAAGSVLLIGGKHLYDDVRDYKIVNGGEIAASSFETIGGAMAVGGAIAIFMTGGAVIPFALFFGGIALALGSGMAHNEAEEDRVARQIWDAIISGNFAALAGLSHDARHEFDDDAVVDLFENYFIPQSFLAPDIWKADELKYLREKIIKELGGEDFFSYMGDDEAAYRLFAALNESEEEAMMVAKQMDRSDWEAFDTFRKAHVPSLVVPASVEAVRK